MGGGDDWFDDEDDVKESSKDSDQEESYEDSFDDVLDDDEDGEFEDEFGDEEGREKKKRVVVEDQNKYLQIDGTVIVTKRDEKGLPIELAIDSGKVRYPIQMDNMGKQLLKYCFNQVFVGGILKADGANKIFEVKNFI